LTKLTMTSKCTSVAANFEGLADAPEQYRQHLPMQLFQGYYGSHWRPASGNYSLRIAPAAARATGIQTTINKHMCKDGHFDGHGDAPVRDRVHRLIGEVQSFNRSHWTPPSGKYYAR
jgi:hypothetical protein